MFINKPINKQKKIKKAKQHLQNVNIKQKIQNLNDGKNYNFYKLFEINLELKKKYPKIHANHENLLKKKKYFQKHYLLYKKTSLSIHNTEPKKKKT